MKKTIKAYQLIAIIFLSLFLISGARAQAQEAPKEVFVRVKVDGLSCPFCAYGLEKKLKKIEGSRKVFIDLQAGEATFIVAKEKKPSREKLEEIVKDAGFVPREISFSEIEAKKKKDED